MNSSRRSFLRGLTSVAGVATASTAYARQHVHQAAPAAPALATARRALAPVSAGSLGPGVVPVVTALLIGGTLGLIAGFVGGRVNMLIMRVTDVFYAFPSILLAVAIAGSLGAGIGNALLAITVVFIPPITRVMESVTTQVRAMDFVEAARASGASNFAIMRVHILGNVLGPVLVYTTVLVSVSIVISAGLSFIGLGASPPAAEWGLMLNTLRESIFLAPLNAVLPGFVIFITSMCFNLISDGLRSAMDMRS